MVCCHLVSLLHICRNGLAKTGAGIERDDGWRVHPLVQDETTKANLSSLFRFLFSSNTVLPL
jgi:hypothetical protein